MLSDPIFLFGISARSGTNYLWDALRIHRFTGVAQPIWEDMLFLFADDLQRYVDRLSAHFRMTNPRWEVHDLIAEEMPHRLGQAIVSFIGDRVHPDLRILTKTPDVRNLHLVSRLVPDAYVVVIVRDGRDVVESAVKTFGWDHRTATRVWVAGGRTIRLFESDPTAVGERYLRIRYEELRDDPSGVIRRVLAFTKLGDENYDFDALANLPVRGSSVNKGDANQVHWKPVEKSPEFFADRWAHWDRAQQVRFDWVAGDLMEFFGYPRSNVKMTALDRVKNAARDKLGPLVGRVRGFHS
jgi:hypothetical protein